MTRHYVLLDACVPAAHYAPKSTHNATLIKRATTLLTGMSPEIEVRFMIPNFCIPEVFAVFEKYRWGHTWNTHVKRKSTLTPAEFVRARQDFSTAIHNGEKILQIELDRYHVLCVDLISPINNAYKIKRVGGKATSRNKARNTRPASTYDMLVAAMGIWLSQQHGPANLTVVTGDERLSNVVDRAKSFKLAAPIRKHLTEIASRLGLKYGPDLYPKVIDLNHATKAELRNRFRSWDPAW